MKLIANFKITVSEKTKTFIANLRKEKNKFSLTLDEWTSHANRRYINVNLHYNENGQTKHIDFGLIRILNKCDAVKLEKLVILKTFLT